MKISRSSQKFVVFAFLIIFSSLILAQDISNSKKTRPNQIDYRKIAIEMKEYYDNGALNNVIKLFKEKCLPKDKNAKPGEEKKVKKEIRANIYKWVMLSYYALDKPEMGDIYLKKLLDIKHKLEDFIYWPSVRKRAEEKFFVVRRLLLGVKLGANRTIAKSLNSFSILEPINSIGEDGYEKSYNPLTSISPFGIIIEFAWFKNLSINFQPSFTIHKFQYRDLYIIQRQSVDNDSDSFTVDVTSHQTLHFIELPLLLKYRFGRAKLQPYLQFGGYISSLQTASKKMEIKRTEVIGQYEDSDEITVENISIKDNLTKKLKSGLCFGVGFDHDIGNLRWGFEINYKHLFGNIVNKNHRYDDDIALGYYDVLDDITISNFEISLHVLFPIYFKAFRL